MCGIVGYIGKKTSKDFLLTGLKRLEYRGYDSCGIATFTKEDRNIKNVMEVENISEINKISKTNKINEFDKINEINKENKIVKMNEIKNVNMTINIEDPKNEKEMKESLKNSNWEIYKSTQRVNELIKNTKDEVFSNIGIGHTRWATHGIPNLQNAHPHLDMKKKFAVVHNGIIENYLELKNNLMDEGYTFYSDTDTEIIANLLSYHYTNDVKVAIQKTMQQLEGSFALGILCVDTPDVLYVARNKSPLLIGIKENETFVASDICAISDFTNQFYLLENEEFAILQNDCITFWNLALKPMEKKLVTIALDDENLELGSFPHYMKKEIFETPIAVRQTLEAYLDENREIKLGIEDTFWEGIDSITIVGCGTAMHAGLAAKYTIEELIGIPVNVEIASEFKYKRFILTPKTFVIFISQSGETADTIAAQEIVKEHGIKHLSIVNVPNSTLARVSDAVLYTKAGIEVAVASTKAYIAQVTLLNIIALYLAKKRNAINQQETKQFVDELFSIPTDIESILEEEKKYQKYAQQIKEKHSMFFIGRGIDYDAVLEGSLKLKEISYVHSEAYQAGELKHGTIALIEKGTKVIAVCTDERMADKTMSNIKEVIARGAEVLYITNCENITENIFEEIILLPKTNRYLSVLLSVIPMQLIAYYTTVAKELDVDKPRNLAKSVTVE